MKGSSGMGSHKHGVSGGNAPSPKAKLMRMLDANRLAEQEAKRKSKPPVFATLSEAMRHGRK